MGELCNLHDVSILLSTRAENDLREFNPVADQRDLWVGALGRTVKKVRAPRWLGRRQPAERGRPGRVGQSSRKRLLRWLFLDYENRTELIPHQCIHISEPPILYIFNFVCSNKKKRLLATKSTHIPLAKKNWIYYYNYKRSSSKIGWVGGTLQ